MWVWEPLFEWTRQTRAYWSHWSACSGLNFTLPCATDITHTRVVGLSKYFTSHSVQLFDPDESPRLWEWDAEWGSAVSPRGDVFKLDVKTRRLPFVQLPTVQETFFFFWFVCLLLQFPLSLCRFANTMDNSHQRTICWDLKTAASHQCKGAGGKTANNYSFTPSDQTLQNPFTTFCFKGAFLFTQPPTHLVLSWFLGESSCLA